MAKVDPVALKQLSDLARITEPAARLRVVEDLATHVFGANRFFEWASERQRIAGGPT